MFINGMNTTIPQNRDQSKKNVKHKNRPKKRISKEEPNVITEYILLKKRVYIYVLHYS